MLDPKVIDIAQRLIDSEYLARRQRFISFIQRVQSELAIKGLAHSGAMLEAVGDGCAQEVQASADRLWEVLRGTLVETGIQYSPDLASELKREFDELFSRYCITDAEGTLNSARMTSGGNIGAHAAVLDSFHGRTMGAREGILAKIDSFAYSLRPPDVDERTKTAVFLSHAASDVQIALLLKKEIERRMPGVKTFCSSDPTDLPPGSKWSPEIQRALQESNLLVFVASPRGLQRPWVWFECGTFWFSKRRVIPLCLGDVRKGGLRPPLSELQAINGDHPDDLTILFDSIAKQTGISLVDASELAKLSETLKGLKRESAIAERVSKGWIGVEWNGRFLAYDGPYEGFTPIEDDAPFEMSMQKALETAGYRVALYDKNSLPRLGEGGKVVQLTDRKSWRRKIMGNGGWLIARPTQ
ncbi:MAG: toll/interleukin-1 receptor domain-containing protein [Candidatus Binataceae bacterium]